MISVCVCGQCQRKSGDTFATVNILTTHMHTHTSCIEYYIESEQYIAESFVLFDFAGFVCELRVFMCPHTQQRLSKST